MARLVYDIWVGGMPINEFYIESRDVAIDIARGWRYDKEYDDVAIEVMDWDTPVENKALGITEPSRVRWITKF